MGLFNCFNNLSVLGANINKEKLSFVTVNAFPLIDEPFLRHRHGLGKLSSIYRYFFPNQFFGLSILYLERGKKSRLSYHNKDRKLPEQSQFINNSEEKKNRKIKGKK